MHYKRECEYLEKFMMQSRIERINEVLQMRTRYITLVLEDIYHPQNASALIRTAECFGIQDIHIIEKNKVYSPNADIVRGASKWLTFHRYSAAPNMEHPTIQCLSRLKKRGYIIAATHLHAEKSITPADIPADRPVALCFGTEETGISQTLKNNADFFIKIPLYGFTESFNVSVAAGIVLNSLSEKIRSSERKWHLTQNETEELKFDWYKKSVKNSEKLLAKLIKR
jgi:tRNA (guanosine-2'-O-)-methyltransferase